MENRIEKEKAVAILQAVKAGTADAFIKKAVIKDALDMAISALEKQEQDRWTPITERMPEENDFVLVTVSGEDVRGCEWKDSMALAVWTNQWNLVDANLVSYSISAWRPLPEPYTEDEDEEQKSSN